MKSRIDSGTPGEIIPLHYHYHMLQEGSRMKAFKDAILQAVPEGGKVLELGTGTGVLSFFAAQKASQVWGVEIQPALVDVANHLIARNGVADKVQIICGNAEEFLPPEPVDVVICEMVHVGILREKQIQVIQAFKRNYREKFPNAPTPTFLPDAAILAVQLVQQDFNFSGFDAPVPMFFHPEQVVTSTVSLADPAVYQMFRYADTLKTQMGWEGIAEIKTAGKLNALRFITKNVVAMIEKENRSIDWFSQYLVTPLSDPVEVVPGDKVKVRFSYQAGESIDALCGSIDVVRSR